jgi:catechol 2,3-dioxygenase-like lactoylglutathione lyase family enzyme
MATPQPDRTFELETVNMDCADAQAMADFYGRLLGWTVTYRNEDFILMENPAGGTGISFQEEPWYQPPVWPEQPGQLTKMIHLDIKVDDLEAAVAQVLAAGGRLAEHQPRSDLRIVLDPAGHPLCLGVE